MNNPGGRTDRVNPATVVTTAKPTTIKPVATPKPVPVGVVGPAIVAKAPSIPPVGAIVSNAELLRSRAKPRDWRHCPPLAVA